MMIDTARVRAVVRKERREYRRTRFIIGTMAVLPVIFLILPVVGLVRLPASASISTVHAQVGSAFLLVLLIPVIVPATIAAYSVIGEREQGTLEPLLSTPLSSDELLLESGTRPRVPDAAGPVAARPDASGTLALRSKLGVGDVPGCLWGADPTRYLRQYGAAVLRVIVTPLWGGLGSHGETAHASRRRRRRATACIWGSSI
jgi:hypothetical protein